MKILHVIPSVASVRGGTSQAVLEMVMALQLQGVDVEIVTTNDNGTDLLAVPLRQKIEYRQVSIRFFPRFSPVINSVKEFAFSAQLTHWLWQNVEDYDLLHVHALFSYPSTIAMSIARHKNLPYICLPHGLLCQWSLQQKARKKQIYLQLIERANLKGTQALHLTSEQERQEVAELGWHYPDFILPHGLSMPALISNSRQKLRQKLRLPEDEPIIIFLSRLHPKKGLDYLIPALARLNYLRFTFVLAGSGTPDYEAEVQDLIQKYGLANRTHLAGFVEGEDKNLFLQGADIFALTSHSENFGVVVLEALAAGTSVLVTPGVALAPMLQREKLGYVTDLNIEAISSALKDCLDNLSEVTQKGDRARQFILEQYSWESIALKLIDIYKSAIDQKSLPVLS